MELRDIRVGMVVYNDDYEEYGKILDIFPGSAYSLKISKHAVDHWSPKDCRALLPSEIVGIIGTEEESVEDREV